MLKRLDETRRDDGRIIAGIMPSTAWFLEGQLERGCQDANLIQHRLPLGMGN